jgi:ornithine cyclodeaminase
MVYDNDEQRLGQYIDEMGPVLKTEVVAAADVGEVITEAQVVVTCTPSRKPYVKADWIHPGLHITAMGADLPEKQEFELDAIQRADMLVCDRKSQSFSMGEFHHAFEAGLISETSPVIELGEITAGLKPGRQSDDQFTICDLSGTGVQDTAIANLALQQAAKKGIGIEIEIKRG